MRGQWRFHRHVRGVVDLSAPDARGAVVVAAAGRLLEGASGGAPAGFAPGYAAPPGLEPYIVRSSGRAVPGAGCRFAAGAIYALRLEHGDGVTEVTAAGRVSRLARLPRSGLENGLAFDATGRFGHRLLVTATANALTSVFAVDCRGRTELITRSAPRVEGGLVVAPAGFGRFSGELIAPDERSGRLYAIDQRGRVRLLARSGLPHGPDTGVESEGFVPARFANALVADRRTPRNHHPGDDQILTLSRSALAAAGVRPGALLAVTEGGARTIAVDCGRTCRVSHVADGPAIAHVEGHIVFR